MVEGLGPAQTAIYREGVTPQTWKRFLNEMQAA